MKKTIVFIHGMFLNGKAWDDWKNYFEKLGFDCLAPSWPLHEGVPSELRSKIPAGLGELRLQTVLDKYVNLINALPSKPILIGHSVGGLLVQLLMNKDLGEMGVAICSVPPFGVLNDEDLGKLENGALILDPSKGNEPFIMTEAIFGETFCNTMHEAEVKRAFERYATSDSRNVLRDAISPFSTVDLDAKRKILFVAAEKDQIIPPFVNQKNVMAYENLDSVIGYKEFANRGHFICGEPRWDDVASYVGNWITSLQGSVTAPRIKQRERISRSDRPVHSTSKKKEEKK